MASAFQAFGQKIANITDLHPTSAQGHANSGDQFNNAKTIAESLNAKPSIDLFEHIDAENKEKEQLKQAYVKETVMNLKQFGAKLAASSCAPCDMPNGPTNKKHMTGASPAVLEADEASEEIGQPETTETEHDKSVVSGKIAVSHQAMNMNPNGARDALAATVGPRLQRDVNLQGKLMAQGLAKPGNSVTPFPSVEYGHGRVGRGDPRPVNRHWTTPASQRAPNPAAGSNKASSARVKRAAPVALPPAPIDLNPGAAQQMDQRYARNRALTGQVVGGLVGAATNPVVGAATNVATRAGLNHAFGDVALKGIVPGAGVGSGMAGPGGEKQLLQRTMQRATNAMQSAISPTGIIKTNSARVKSAVMGAGTVIGALGGLATGRSGQRARAAGRGAAKGLGWDIGATVGAAPGMALGGLGGLMLGGPGGAALGIPLGGVAGGLTGGLLGHSVASSAIGPDETDEEKLERLLALREKMQRNNGKSAAHVFGSKVAAIAFDAPAGDYASAPRPAWHDAVDREALERANSGLAANLPPPHLQGGPAPKPKTTPWYRPDQYGGQRNWFDSAIETPGWLVGKAFKGLKQAPQSVKEIYGMATELPDAIPNKPNWRPPSMVPDMSGTSGSGAVLARGKPGPIAMPSPETPAPVGGGSGALGGMDLQTALMYGIPIGLGGAGLYALYNYLNSQPKKKKEEEAPQG